MTNSNLVTGLGGSEGYGEITMPRGDDNTMQIDVSAVFENGFYIDGVHYDADDIYVSTNGFVQFGSPNAGVSPWSAYGWIAPYNIDLDTRTVNSNTNSGQVHVDVDAATDTVTVTWDQVGRYYGNGNPPFSFQLQLTQETDGSTTITFRYGDMELGSPIRWARIGYDLGTQALDNPLDSTVNPEDFDTTIGNTGVAGVWEYVVNIAPTVGTDGNDTITGTAGNDAIFGLRGRDTIDGLAGDDLLSGGNGADHLIGGAGDDTLIGGHGPDALVGGTGSDTADYRGSPGFVADLTDASINTGDAAGDTFDSIENLAGGGGNDWLAGDGGANEIIGRAGNDILLGRGGNDTLGGRNGDDILRGGDGDDHLHGGRGNDLLIGGDGADYLDGGSDFDTVSYAESTSHVIVDLFDPLNNGGDAAGDTYYSIESIVGTAFDDQLSAGFGSHTTVRLDGGDGNDELNGSRASDTLIGGNGDDWLHGGQGSNVLLGGEGNDYLIGSTSNSTSHTATSIGGAGNDTIRGFVGIDIMDGGAGQDEASFVAATESAGQLIVDLENGLLNAGFAAGDVLTDIENITGSYYDDILRGDGQANLLRGMAGDDQLFGRAGDDRLEGRAGDDVLNGGAGNDLLIGGGGIDTFVYGTGADVVQDFAGDRLRLDDALWGNANLTEAQILAFATVVGGDTVFDFGGGNTLTLTGVTDLGLLTGQIDVF